jgi:3-phosphoshikimate 1-carboxyvinyltransferase
VRSGRRVHGTLAPPPSKSLTHRYFTLALLADAELTVERPLDAEDTRLFLALLERIGFTCDRQADAVHLVPPAVPSERMAGEPVELFCGNAGTLLRLVTAALATRPGAWRIDGSARMRERPIGPLLAALRAQGVRLDELGAAGHPPIVVHGGRLAGGRIEVDAGESSQYLSALLLAALAARGDSEIVATALTSSPYVDLTLATAREMGGRIERLAPAAASALPPREPAAAARFRVVPGLHPPRRVRVEGDWSAAAYPAAAALLTGGTVRLTGLRGDSAQGDRGFLGLLARMGAEVRSTGEEIVVSGVAARQGGLAALEVDLGAMPDQVPTLAALAPFAHGTTRIYGVPHLRLKESDRLAAMTRELRRAGASVEETADGLVIEGVWARRSPPSDPLTVESWNDHRIAMSMALVGLRRPGLSVAAPEVVAKSYPGFWHDLENLLVG